MSYIKVSINPFIKGDCSVNDNKSPSTKKRH